MPEPRGTSRGRKWAKRLLLCLLLGAVINVAVAWTPGVWYGLSSRAVLIEETEPTAEQIRWWRRTVSPVVDDEPTVVWRRDIATFGVEAEHMETDPHWSRLRTVATRWRAGVPFRSMGYHAWWVEPRSFDASETHSSWFWAFNVRRKGGWGTVVLPLTPIWSGFVADTLFNAALVGFVWGGAVMLKRSIRRAKGRCAHCGYPRGTSPVCTECGEPLPC